MSGIRERVLLALVQASFVAVVVVATFAYRRPRTLRIRIFHLLPYR